MAQIIGSSIPNVELYVFLAVILYIWYRFVNRDERRRSA